MIHNPELEVTCDGCNKSVFIGLERNASGYDLNSDKINYILESEHDWTVYGFEHYCDLCSKGLLE